VAVNYSSDKKGAERVLQEIIDGGGEATSIGADVLVNNAGVFCFGAFAEITEESFHTRFNINVLGNILTMQETIKRFGADGGSIINFSSIGGSNPVPGAPSVRTHEI